MSEPQQEGLEFSAITRLDEKSIRLQREQKPLEALECLEKSLILRQHFYGANSDETITCCKTIGNLCNLLAMTFLQQEDYHMVLELLKKAEIVTEHNAIGKAATFNNYACYYRRRGKLHSALQYLQKSLKLESEAANVRNLADTHINTCAVLSQLGRHQQALEHAQQALILLQEELLNISPTGSNSNNSDEEQKQQESSQEPHSPPQLDRIAVLAIAYHNTGVELEFLKRYEACVASYRKGAEVAEKYLGETHAVTTTLKTSLAAARKVATNAASIKSHAQQSRTISKQGHTVSEDVANKLNKSPYVN